MRAHRRGFRRRDAASSRSAACVSKSRAARSVQRFNSRATAVRAHSRVVSFVSMAPMVPGRASTGIHEIWKGVEAHV